jgi:hypothetical protein
LITGTPTRSAHSESCSTAAARKVSHAATITFFFSFTSRCASFATEVVLPEPFTPTISTTVGPLAARTSSGFGSPSFWRSSSRSRTRTSSVVASLRSR